MWHSDFNLPRSARLMAGVVPLVALLSCHSQSPADQRAKYALSGTGDVVIAAAWPWAARVDVRYGEGLDLAAAEINASGGIDGRRLRIVRYDDEESVNVGRLLAERLAADASVVAVIGHLQSYVSVATAGTYARAGLVMVAPTATDPALTQLGSNRIFRATFSEQEIGRQMARLALATAHRRLAIVYIRSRYGRGLANAFEAVLTAGGGTIVARQSYDPGANGADQSFATIVRELRAQEFDAIFLAGEVPSATRFVIEARTAGVTAQIYGGDAMSSPALLAAGGASEGVIVATMFQPDDPRPEVRTFVAAFRARYGTDPDVGSASGYDAVHVLAAAMRHAKSSVPDSVALAMREMPLWHGVTGPFRFTANGELAERPMVLAIVREGRFALFEQPAHLASAIGSAAP